MPSLRLQVVQWKYMAMGRATTVAAFRVLAGLAAGTKQAGAVLDHPVTAHKN